MVKRLLASFALLLAAGATLAQQADYDKAVAAYVERYKSIALREMREYRIPASITLAQGILESNAGRSDLATEANNHFGIKCHKEWEGERFFKDDDEKNECFRKYKDPLTSFRDHSAFLTSRDRYKSLFSLSPTDYQGWATGLKAAGYATNPAYAQLLVKTIEKYHLDRFDLGEDPQPAIAGKPVPAMPAVTLSGRFRVTGSAPGNRTLYENNGLRMIIASEDDNLYIIARDLGISVDRLLKYNDMVRATALESGQPVYLQKKKRRAATDFHRVSEGESLYSIAQQYGIRMKQLLGRNELRVYDEPVAGTLLKLR